MTSAGSFKAWETIRSKIDHGRFYTTAELLKFFGVSSLAALRRRINYGVLPNPVVHGGMLLWPRRDVDELRRMRENLIGSIEFAKILGVTVGRFYAIKAAGELIPHTAVIGNQLLWDRQKAKDFAERRCRLSPHSNCHRPGGRVTRYCYIDKSDHADLVSAAKELNLSLSAAICRAVHHWLADRKRGFAE